jgi:hypothetical protein
VRLLRNGLKQPAGYKSGVQQHAAAMRSYVASAQAAVEAIRECASYDPRAKSLVAEVDRLTNDSDRVLQELDTRGKWRGSKPHFRKSFRKRRNEVVRVSPLARTTLCGRPSFLPQGSLLVFQDSDRTPPGHTSADSSRCHDAGLPC